MSWTDVHTHIDKLEVGPEDAIKLAAANGVSRMITIGTCPDDLQTVLDLAKKFHPAVSCSLGIHPHEAELYTDAIGQWIRANAVAPEVAAIGETGLDYYYEHAPRDPQLHAFREQMRIAKDLGMPVEIHTRDAEDDTKVVLTEFKGKVFGLLHCFTGTWDMAKHALDQDFYISISGVATFKNAGDLREVIKKVPLDRLHVETDAPFLAPIPHRGKKNQPAWVIHTAQLVAELKGVTLEQLSSALEKNARAMFPKLANPPSAS